MGTFAINHEGANEKVKDKLDRVPLWRLLPLICFAASILDHPSTKEGRENNKP